MATPSGVGAIAIIRVSGLGCIPVVNAIFKGKNLENVETHTVHFGTIQSSTEIIDEVLVSVFKSPKSFTKEDSVEISCHGSDYIIRQILKGLVQNGARIAKPGEFTQRAFLNGQFDLVQAEAVADLIAADSEASHKTALNQLRGGFSKKLTSLRTELIHFASLIELELDFGDEDVEFAGRDDLRELIESLQETIAPLIESFDYGNALKEGVPVAIIGSPNVGKSTLLNALLNEEKAIVTSVAGTTRDVIEDTIVLEGLKFRFIDTAGIRETTDLVESIGIERSKGAMEKADVVIFLFDSEETFRDLKVLADALGDRKKVVWVRNKVDLDVGHVPHPGPLLGGEREDFEEVDKQGEKDKNSSYQAYKSLIFKVPDAVLENARMLRQEQTDAESFLWLILRNRGFNDMKFRRQHPLEEGFVLDFFCAKHRLGVELDGGIHFDKEQALYDRERSVRIKELYGIEILRFSNDQVLNDLEGVLFRILAFLGQRDKILKHLTPPPLLLGGEGEQLGQSPFSSKEKGLGVEVIQGKELRDEVIYISAQTQHGLESLKSHIVNFVKTQAANDTVVTNLRHYEHLIKTQDALSDVLNGLATGVTGDFLAQDIRLSLHHLGEITGTIVTDDLLDNIFSKFCIGK